MAARSEASDLSGWLVMVNPGGEGDSNFFFKSLAMKVFIKFKKSWHVKLNYFMPFPFRTDALLIEGTDAFNCIL